MNVYYNARIIIYNIHTIRQLTMTDFKHLVSPFTLVPYASGHGKMQLKQMPRPAPPCNCDSDDENDFGMAPECAFVCNAINAFTHKKSKKRNPKKPDSLKKTKRHNKNMV